MSESDYQAGRDAVCRELNTWAKVKAAQTGDRTVLDLVIEFHQTAGSYHQAQAEALEEELRRREDQRPRLVR